MGKRHESRTQGEGMDRMRGAIIDMTKNAFAGIDIVDGHPELFRKTA